MFERFTENARGVVTGSLHQAERQNATHITEEHLLLALMEVEGGRAAFAFASLGIDRQREAVVDALAQARRRGGMSQAETDALADIGIDVDAIVTKVEEAHGEGALGGPPRKGWWRPKGHRPFTTGAKKVVEQSLRVALGRGDKFIGEEHLLLALTVRPGAVAEVLAEFGAGYGEVERAMYGTAK